MIPMIAASVAMQVLPSLLGGGQPTPPPAEQQDPLTQLLGAILNG